MKIEKINAQTYRLYSVPVGAPNIERNADSSVMDVEVGNLVASANWHGIPLQNEHNDPNQTRYGSVVRLWLEDGKYMADIDIPATLENSSANIILDKLEAEGLSFSLQYASTYSESESEGLKVRVMESVEPCHIAITNKPKIALATVPPTAILKQFSEDEMDKNGKTSSNIDSAMADISGVSEEKVTEKVIDNPSDNPIEDDEDSEVMEEPETQEIQEEAEVLRTQAPTVKSYSKTANKLVIQQQSSPLTRLAGSSPNERITKIADRVRRDVIKSTLLFI